MTDGASGQTSPVPIFPLPEVVLFPRQLLPLHVFEPRYRELTADVLAGDGLIAISLLRDGFEPRYFSRHAPIHRIAGLGRIVASEELTDGRYNILLRGECRIELLEELNGRAYRRAYVNKRSSEYKVTAHEFERLRDRLWESVRENLVWESELRCKCMQLFQTELPLGALTDLIGGGLPIVGELRQCLLAETDVAERTELLLQQLHTLGSVARRNRRRVRQPEWSPN